MHKLYLRSALESWPVDRLPAGYEIAATSHAWSDDVIDLARRALGNIPLLQNVEVTYEPVDMTIVPCQS